MKREEEEEKEMGEGRVFIPPGKSRAFPFGNSGKAAQVISPLLPIPLSWYSHLQYLQIAFILEGEPL